jgi:hypothetical protein
MKVSYASVAAFLLGASNHHGADAFAPLKKPTTFSALKMVRFSS